MSARFSCRSLQIRLGLVLLSGLLANPLWALSRDDIQRKVEYAHLLVNVSEQARRIADSDNAEARKLRRQAEQQVQQASSALEKGDLEAAARAVNEAFRLYTLAAQMVPDPKLLEQRQREEYAHLLSQVFAFEAWTKDNKGSASIAWIREVVDKAQGLAIVGYREEANRILNDALNRMIDEVSRSLEAKTITYDLDFDTPEDEYRYELRRNKDYVRLIPIAIGQRQPSENVRKLIERLTRQASELRAQAERLFERGQVKQAIKTMEQSTEKLQRALKMLGVH